MPSKGVCVSFFVLLLLLLFPSIRSMTILIARLDICLGSIYRSPPSLTASTLPFGITFILLPSPFYLSQSLSNFSRYRNDLVTIPEWIVPSNDLFTISFVATRLMCFRDEVVGNPTPRVFGLVPGNSFFHFVADPQAPTEHPLIFTDGSYELHLVMAEDQTARIHLPVPSSSFVSGNYSVMASFRFMFPTGAPDLRQVCPMAWLVLTSPV